MGRAARRSALALLAAACLLLVGCTTSPPTAAPVKLAVSVFQYRSDYAIRGLQIHVENRSKTDITVTSARFESPYFGAALSSKSAPSPVFAGVATDFPVDLPVSSCSADSPSPSVVVKYTTATGGTGVYRAVPTDPFDSLGVVHAADCSRQAFEKIATIRVASALRERMLRGKPVALLEITLTPTGAAGEATLDSIGSTTLLSGVSGELRTFDTRLTAASTPLRFTLEYTPARCEQHIVAEDKVGTVIPFRVTTGAFSNALFGYPVSPAVKLQFYDYVAKYCGWEK